MNPRYLRIVVLGTITAGLALSQQACSAEVTPTTAAPGSAAPTATTAVKPGPAGAATPKQTRKATPQPTTDIPYEPEDNPASSVPGCLNKDINLSVTAQDQIGQDKYHYGLVHLANISGHTCKLRGNFAVALVNAAKENVEVPTKLVNQPGKAITVNVQRGGGAWAGIRWTACDKSDLDCGAGNSLKWNLQSTGNGKFAELADFPAPEKSNLTMGSLQIGTIQPIRDGVVAW